MSHIRWDSPEGTVRDLSRAADHLMKDLPDILTAVRVRQAMIMAVMERNQIVSVRAESDDEWGEYQRGYRAGVHDVYGEMCRAADAEEARIVAGSLKPVPVPSQADLVAAANEFMREVDDSLPRGNHLRSACERVACLLRDMAPSFPREEPKG